MVAFPLVVTAWRVRPLALEETTEIAESKSVNAAWTVVAEEFVKTSNTPIKYAPEVRADPPVASRRIPCIDSAFDKARAPPVAFVKNRFVLEAVEAKLFVLVTLVATTSPSVESPVTFNVPVAVRFNV